MTKSRDLANAATALNAVSATELGFVDGVTSAIQTQIDTKQAVVSGVDDTEIGYLDGVTSAVQTQLNSKITNPMTTTGDTIYSSSGSTPARLGIGTSGQLLQVSGAGVPEWTTPAGGGGMTLLSTTTLTSSSTNITSISGSYNNLQIQVEDVYATSGAGPIQVRLNGENGLHFGLAQLQVGASTVTQYSNDAVIYLWNNTGTQLYSATRKVNASIEVYNYASSNLSKAYQYCGAYADTSGSVRSGGYGGGAFWSSTAITSVTIFNDNTLNGTIKIWGIK